MKNQKFTYAELKEMQAWPLEDKILRATSLIAHEIRNCEKPVVACSFGKASIVVLHLVRRACKKAVVVFHNTLCQYPETYAYRDLILKEWGIENYHETKPIKTFWECVEEYGFPQFRNTGFTLGGKKPRTPKCCVYLKEKPQKLFHKQHGTDCEFIGLQASESMVRRLSFFREGEAFDSKSYGCRIVRPIMIWTDKDIWEYHDMFEIPRNPIYEKMPRNGCMPCTGFKNWKAQLAEVNPRMYKYISNKMGQPLLEQFTEVPCQ
jgi:3'-phosphoadenosine 5'-phosphosulfate sulfotransferase (PAPS reductase)/FAD synthetase